MNRRAFIQLLTIPLLAAACGGDKATNAPENPTATALAPTTAPAVVASQAVSPAAPAATASRTVAVATATRAATTIATPSAATAARTGTVLATASRAASATAAASPSSAAVSVPFPPNGVAPAGWQTYAGNTRVPFSLYFPPDWTVDESRAGEGRVYFYAPGVREPYEDALWVLIATTGRVEPTGNIDVLRDQYFNTDIRSGHPEAGIDVTRSNQFSGLTFASIGATFNANEQLCYAYIGLGLRGGVPWRFRLNSRYADYSRNLDSTFAPMIGSLNIYKNP